jgi:L-ascorbate metabolism protein UlaG (beta-lactamase superfamily)
MGHACVLVENKHASVLVDPYLSYEYPTQLPRYTIADLPGKIDYVLITHPHEDHISFEHLLRLRHRIGTVIVPHTSGRSLQDPSMKSLLEATGFKGVREMRELERVEFEGGAITAIPFLGEHSELDIQCKSGYLIESFGTSIACVADSCNFDNEMYVHLAKLLGSIDVLFVGMECEGAPLSRYYGILHTQRPDRKFDSRRDKASNFQQASALIEAWTPSHAYVYAMGLEPWLNHLLPIQGESLSSEHAKKFVAHCTERRIHSEVLYGQKELVFRDG